ncbi:MAG: hypothetical protein ACREQI_00025 [Candidatus Binataceae bacterium]
MKIRAMAPVAAGLAAILAIAGCAANGVRGATVVAAGNDTCEVDVNRICAQVKGRPIRMASTGLMADARMVEQNSIRTAPIQTSLALPSGAILQVECEISYPKENVVYAHLLKGPNFTIRDIGQLRDRGLCVNSGQSAMR